MQVDGIRSKKVEHQSSARVRVIAYASKCRRLDEWNS